jgi:hypothetical protein
MGEASTGTVDAVATQVMLSEVATNPTHTNTQPRKAYDIMRFVLLLLWL